MKPKVEKDPELERQQQAARLEKVNTIQDRLGTETDQSLRYFGRTSGGTGRVPSIVSAGTGSNPYANGIPVPMLRDYILQNRKA